MNDLDLKGCTIGELIAQFVEHAVEQNATVDYLDFDRYEVLDKLIAAISQELSRRGLKARQQLLPLYQHREAQVRLQAARFTYRVTPEAARKCIQAIAESRIQPQDFVARTLLERIDAGIEKLD